MVDHVTGFLIKHLMEHHVMAVIAPPQPAVC
jgi:hypothetical protein